VTNPAFVCGQKRSPSDWHKKNLTIIELLRVKKSVAVPWGGTTQKGEPRPFAGQKSRIWGEKKNVQGRPIPTPRRRGNGGAGTGKKGARSLSASQCEFGGVISCPFRWGEKKKKESRNLPSRRSVKGKRSLKGGEKNGGYFCCI